jgi:hypothetical protein
MCYGTILGNAFGSDETNKTLCHDRRPVIENRTPELLNSKPDYSY